VIEPRLTERLTQIADMPYQRAIAVVLGEIDREK
jgi:hypothetical protein